MDPEKRVAEKYKGISMDDVNVDKLEKDIREVVKERKLGLVREMLASMGSVPKEVYNFLKKVKID
ncbi:hypothetical protein R9C00_14665 [Flammeovirgaceae bacterium SG7u.111]|nr:hypothetical protein [Flammeovirgaceae bacterium SG7u.132]WPO38701.1 hypothetical protein R9C00_14665 [Flammeovirgaceae bacterium SG7u.111]